MTFEVVKPGLLTTLQDAGRPGLAYLGIGRAGAFDAPARRIANALCENPADACALEVTLLGPTLRCRQATWIAVTGAPMAFRVNGVDAPMWAPVAVPAGATIALGAMRAGCRAYLAVRGGFDVGAVLGSRSTDVNARIGPFGGRPLQAGDQLATGATVLPDADQRAHPVSSGGRPDPVAPKWQLDPRPWLRMDARIPLRLLPGAHLGNLTPGSLNRLFFERFCVHADSNRVGVRLVGPMLQLGVPGEMISEGCVPGLLQLPPSGQPIAFGPECPVSGGYPRIGQIAAVDLPRLAQLRPGDALRFAPCDWPEARQALRMHEQALARLNANIARRLRSI